MFKISDGARKACAELSEAFASDDKEQVAQALEGFRDGIAEDLAVQYKQAVADAEASGDRAVLAQRGFRQLTSKETRYYEAVIGALKSPNPKQAFATLADDFSGDKSRALPETVFDQILEDIAQDHPLIGAVKTQNTKMVTTWLKSDFTEQFAAWGALEGAVTKEVTGDIKVKQVTLNKLSCYALLSRDMLELGPTFLDAYVRLAIGEVMACAMEKAIVMGIGIKGEPVGLVREFKSTTSVNASTGYPAKTKTTVTQFDPATYGALVAKLTVDDDGKPKKASALNSLTLVCNTVDYLTKVMPATTVMSTSGAYVNDRFPVPTKVVQSEYLPQGEAVLALLDEYTMFAGGARGIEYSDEYKFLEDQRTFKCVSYAYGEPKDDSTALYLDISKLDPAYVTVKLESAPIVVSEKE